MLGQSTVNWERYHGESFRDDVLWPTASLYRTLWSQGHEPEVWTGRLVSHSDMTVKWFKDHSLPLGRLRMCPEGGVSGHIMKRIWHRADLADGAPYPAMVFCRPFAEVCMWRRENVFCIQVFNGSDE